MNVLVRFHDLPHENDLCTMCGEFCAVKKIGNAPVLVVGETPGFALKGAIINFYLDENKVRFEINNTAAKKSRLDIRSQLLRLAKKVTDEQASNGTQS